jgi:hypothetical protein
MPKDFNAGHIIKISDLITGSFKTFHKFRSEFPNRSECNQALLVLFYIQDQ